MTEYPALHLWVFVVQRKLVKWRMKFYFWKNDYSTDLCWVVGFSFQKSCWVVSSHFLMFQNHAAAKKKKKSVEGVAKDRGAKENNQPSPSIGELSLSYSQWDRLDSRNPLFCKLEVRMWYLYSLVIMVESVKKCVFPYFMAPPAP